MSTFRDMGRKIKEKATELKDKVKNFFFGEKLLDRHDLKDKFLDTRVGQFISDKLSFFKSKQAEASAFALTKEQKESLQGCCDIDVPVLREQLADVDENTRQIAGVALVTEAMDSVSKSYDKVGYNETAVANKVADMLEYHAELSDLDKSSATFKNDVAALKDKYGKDVVKLYDNTVSAIEKYNNNKKEYEGGKGDYADFINKNYKVAYGIGDIDMGGADHDGFADIIWSKGLSCVALTEAQYNGEAAIDVEPFIAERDALFKKDEQTETPTAGTEGKSDGKTDDKTNDKSDETTDEANKEIADAGKETTKTNDDASNDKKKTESFTFKRPSEEEVKKVVDSIDGLRKYAEENNGTYNGYKDEKTGKTYNDIIYDVGSMMKNAGIKCDAYSITELCVSRTHDEAKKYFDTAFDVEESFSKIADSAERARNHGEGGFNTAKAETQQYIVDVIEKIREVYPDYGNEVADLGEDANISRKATCVTDMLMSKDKDSAMQYLRDTFDYASTDTEDLQLDSDGKKVALMNTDLGVEVTEQQLDHIIDLTTKIRQLDLSSHKEMYESYKNSVGLDSSNTPEATKEEYEAALSERAQYFNEIFGDEEMNIHIEGENGEIGTYAVSVGAFAELMCEQYVDLNLDGKITDDVTEDERNEYIKAVIDLDLNDEMRECVSHTFDAYDTYLSEEQAKELESDQKNTEDKTNKQSARAAEELGDFTEEDTTQNEYDPDAI